MSAPERTAESVKAEGNVAYKEKRYNAAIKLYSESLRLEKNHLVFGNRGQAYLILKQYELSLRDLNKAIEMEPTFSKHYYRRSQVLRDLGLISMAREDYSASLRYKPTIKEHKEVAATIEKRENTRYTEVKQWDAGEEFEEDDMIPIMIGGIVPAATVPDVEPVTVVPEEATVSPVVDTVAPTSEQETQQADGQTTVAEDTVDAPATIDTPASGPETEESTVATTVDTVSGQDTVANAEVEEATVAAVPDTVEGSQNEEERGGYGSSLLSPLSSDLSFVSARETNESFQGERKQEEDSETNSTFSDLHSNCGEELSGEFASVPGSPNDTLDNEEVTVVGTATPIPSLSSETGDSLVESEKEEKREEVPVPKPRKTAWTIPPNYMDFLVEFEQLRDEEELVGKYMMSIPPTRYEHIFSNLLTDDQLTVIVRGMERVAENDPSTLPAISSCLYHLSLLPRFDILVMFMNDEIRKKALSLIDSFSDTEERTYLKTIFG